MNQFKILSITAAILFAQLSFCSDAAQAGPLLNWLRSKCSLGKQNSCSTCTTPGVTNSVAGCGLQPGQCQVTCQQSCSRTVVNYVPYTAYRTSWEKVPVTQYKPVTSSDPCSGCTVTCMKPCTTYNWQQKQVPYTTYRPVYRQETYKVPVSYITNDCNSCGSCNTCNTSASQLTNTSAMVPSGCSTCNIPQYATQPMPGALSTTPSYGTLDTTGSYNTPTSPTPAANIPPSLDGVNPIQQQRPIIEMFEGASWKTTPAVTARPTQLSVARNSWDYSPVRLASYTNEATVSTEKIMQPIEGRFLQTRTKDASLTQPSNKKAGWTSTTW